MIKPNIASHLAHSAAAIGAAAFLAGCASLTNPSTPEAAVGERAATYWQARQAAQVEKAYALTSPAYRQVRSLDQFRRDLGGATLVQSVEVASVTCEPAKCVARIKLNVTPALPGLKLGTIASYIDEIWLLEDGQWWRHQDL